MGFAIDNLLWSDRKRYFGLPLSFTTYAISEDRLLQATGILNLRYEEILLYRIRDISLSRSLGQMIFGVGTITIISSDKTSAKLEIENVKAPKEVKELIHQLVEEAKSRRRFRFGEFDSVSDDFDDNMGMDA